MAIDAPRAQTAVTTAVGTRGNGPSWYTLYGFSVQSDLRLPVPAIPAPAAGEPDLIIRRIDGQPAPEPDGRMVAWMPCRVHGADVRVHRGPGGAWIWNRTIGTCHVSADVRRVDVYPDPEADDGALGLVLAGPIALYALHKRGIPSLHASAVVTPHGAIAFMGAQGHGKSTMAASFIRRGATILTDDALPLRVQDNTVVGEPGLPFMKLWRETAQHALALDDELPKLIANFEKRYLDLAGRYAFANAPVPLRGIYLLNRYDPTAHRSTEIVVQSIATHLALANLLAQTSNRSYLLPAEEAAFLPVLARLLVQAPLRLLSYPNGFRHQQAVYERIMADVETR